MAIQRHIITKRHTHAHINAEPKEFGHYYQLVKGIHYVFVTAYETIVLYIYDEIETA